ncbi:NUDIX domain-containing protein [Pseudonocardiaceae bacterium YIM PH 21723]|nr:NUDIX domain-containing protein [Pseudonocardiaceae bacterium YIM PH 21723]
MVHTAAVGHRDREQPGGHVSPIVGVGAVLVNGDGAVLLGNRIKAGESPTWCLPGGHLEPGESFAEAAIRETAEESGITAVGEARVFGVAHQLDHPRVYLTAGVQLTLTDRDAVPTLPEPEVFDRWIWADPLDLPAPLFPAADALLAGWLGRPAPVGWSTHAIRQP